MPEKTSSQDKVFALLSALAVAPEPITARELAEQTGLPLSSTYRYLAALSRWSMVQERHSGHYAPGPMAVQLAAGFEQHNSVLTWARPLLSELAVRTGESAALMMVSGRRALCVEMIDSSQALRCCYQKGQSQPLLRGASAKVLLAFADEGLREAALAGLALTPRQELESELRHIHAQGYAVSEGEMDPNIWGVSAPVLSSREQLLGGISLMAPAERVGPAAAQWIRWTCEAAQRLGAMSY
ncbi:IclR family transcriptional regulator [Oceanimonas sp. NS1]|uniref:IclR family transcriptional regulator n=1 Tax=Oceanimonas sp. MB9 TaxID=2588453 RepID=UPI0013F638D0|nr:IclR family transcriptional regulator [Oceanimonas sp. MB9]MCT7654425.1 IclR family transcriptional regulator [Oceanimonas sp. NS1]NHH99354.1 HTH-type transcriptional regulator KipR [Oceanimonas sp. MB9]